MCRFSTRSIWNKLWFSIIELDDPLLHRLLPGCTHGIVQDFRVNECHLWQGMGHPLLDQGQAHSVVNEFNRFGVTKRLEAKVEGIALLITVSFSDQFFRMLARRK